MQANKQGFKAFDPQAAAELAKVSGSVPGSRILVFLHDDRERGLALDAFRAAGLQAHGVKTVAAARKLLGEDFDAFVIDADHPEERKMGEYMAKLTEKNNPNQIVLVTGNPSLNQSGYLTNLGYVILERPLDTDALVEAVKGRLRQKN